MDPFTADFLSSLAAELGGQFIPKAARRLRNGWLGDDSAQALERCLQAGVIGLVSKAALDEPEQEALLADIFSAFFGDAEVATRLMAVIHLQPLNAEDLAFLFAEAGYEAETLPGLRFPRLWPPSKPLSWKRPPGKQLCNRSFRFTRVGRRQSCSGKWSA